MINTNVRSHCCPTAPLLPLPRGWPARPPRRLQRVRLSQRSSVRSASSMPCGGCQATRQHPCGWRMRQAHLQPAWSAPCPIHRGVQVTAVALLTRQFTPGMARRQRGHIINISSVAAHNHYAGGAAPRAVGSAPRAPACSSTAWLAAAPQDSAGTGTWRPARAAQASPCTGQAVSPASLAGRLQPCPARAAPASAALLAEGLHTQHNWVGRAGSIYCGTKAFLDAFTNAARYDLVGTGWPALRRPALCCAALQRHACAPPGAATLPTGALWLAEPGPQATHAPLSEPVCECGLIRPDACRCAGDGNQPWCSADGVQQRQIQGTSPPPPRWAA